MTNLTCRGRLILLKSLITINTDINNEKKKKKDNTIFNIKNPIRKKL